MHVVFGFVGGVFVGGALSYLYAQKVIAKIQAAATGAATAAKKL